MVMVALRGRSERVAESRTIGDAAQYENDGKGLNCDEGDARFDH